MPALSGRYFLHGRTIFGDARRRKPSGAQSGARADAGLPISWAFAMTALGAIGIVATIFTGRYPRVLVSRPTFPHSLTISNAAAGHYALQVITVVAAIFTPIVLLYQRWTYYVFCQQLGGQQAETPVAGLAETTRSPASPSS